MEYQKRFYVQGYFEKLKTVYKWWDFQCNYGRVVSEGFDWYNVTESGKQCHFGLRHYSSPMRSFKTLKQALKQIDIFMSETKYYYPYSETDLDEVKVTLE